MAELSKDILLEILGVLTNATVKRQEPRGSTSISNSLTIGNYLSSVLCESREAISHTSFLAESERVLFVDPGEFFDPKYDFDFRDRKDNSKCGRGGEPYTRPWGYYRFGLKVLDKYPDGNDWLGPAGWRNQSAPGEWPVSFHGTDIKGAKGITGSTYHAGERNRYGRGIYSTPDITIAEDYSMQNEFQSETNDKMYTVIMQNRINPDK